MSDAAEKTKPAAVPPLEHAQLRAALAEERAARAVVQGAELQLVLARRELADAEGRRGELMKDLAQRFELGQGDELQADGTIVRKAAPAAPASGG